MRQITTESVGRVEYWQITRREPHPRRLVEGAVDTGGTSRRHGAKSSTLTVKVFLLRNNSNMKQQQQQQRDGRVEQRAAHLVVLRVGRP